ncbi:MAG: phage/plasmid primase, P4 family [Bacillota bacterium]|nr:phage/plasmid primase, P4 family [Bacillota bacterium]
MSVTANEVIGSLFNPDDVVCFRVFDDKKGGVFSGAKLECEAGKYLAFEPKLKEHNEKNRGVFFVVNYGGQEDTAISRINAQFVEMDDLSFEEQQKLIDAFPLPPSMIIKTRKSLHTYWFMKNAIVERFRTIQKQLVAHFHGDPMCVNESRVMRLPGFNHCKADPIAVECISFHPERKYTQAELSDALPESEDATLPEKKQGSQKGLKILEAECDFIKYCRLNAAGLSEHDWYAMISNIACFEGGTDLIHALSKPYPAYNEQTTQKKINHFFASGTKPMNCSTIVEKGFRCPKLASGECACKSPAGLCYKPLSTDGIRAILGTLPVVGNVLDDAQTAKAFIEDYLYNQDSITAESVINYDLKDHFKFKSAFMRPLIAMYRDVNKAYESAASARRSKATMTVPEWYEFTEKGLKFLPGVLAEQMVATERVFYAAEDYYLYGGGVYSEMTEMEAQHKVQKAMIPRETKMNQIMDAEHQWRLQVQKNIRDLNANPFIINLRNGLYNVLEDTLTDHSPDYCSTVQLGVSYDRDAKCPRFEQFLAESMDGDMGQVQLIQEMLGYFLIPINSAQKCFVVVGAGGAGKSVLLRVLNEILLGKKNVSNVSWQALNERFKTAELFGKLANIFADLPTKNIDDNGIFKALVGEDYLTVEKKNKNPFSFQSTARLLFSCNSIPKNYGDRSEGFYRRLIIIRFNHTVPPDKRDPHLIDKFRDEADGIFMFALAGLKKLLISGYNFDETDINRAELQKYREDSDSVLSFVKECCEIDVSYEVGSTEIFNTYKNYCEECGLKPYSQKAFVGQLTTSYPTIAKGIDTTGRRRILTGIRLGKILA